MQNTDSIFLKHFAMVIAALFAVMLLLIIGALVVHRTQGLNDDNPAKAAQIEQRIAPVGAVYSGDTGLASIVAAQEAAKAAASAKVAFDGAVDGELIFTNVCGACHLSGAGGAPLPTREAWAPRIAKGIDLLVTHAIGGFQGQAGVMPAKGGRPDLSDEQVKATVEYMVAKYK